MQVLEVEQIKAWDAYTIQHEPIASVDLMERAALACYHWLIAQGYKGKRFTIYCAKGNNGGDGLALARLLSENDMEVEVYILEFGKLGTPDFQTNLSRLHETNCRIHFISTPELIHPIAPDTIIIDALFGSGLNKPIRDLSALLVDHINKTNNQVISIDLPSGLFSDKSSAGNTVIKASHTLSFQCYKPAFLVPENAPYIGQLHILDIGLHPDFLSSIQTTYHLLEKDFLKRFFKKRSAFSHKGTHGHAGLIAGSYGMMGAAVIAALACMRTGAGKLTCHLPDCGINIMQHSVPEAMCQKSGEQEYLTTITDIEKYDALAIGPGIGMHRSNEALLRTCLSRYKRPLIIDADALNTLAEFPELLNEIPKNSVLTPHVKEFEKVFGKSANDFDRIKLAMYKANALRIIIVLKGKYSFIAMPGSEHFFNTTGNPGMAKAGNGDMVTGMLLALLAQGYTPEQTACLGVYLHGRAADIASSDFGEEALLPTDSIAKIGIAFREVY